MSSALFEFDGSRVVATELARGPWDARHCHGGPVAAVLARAVSALQPDDEDRWQFARMTVELARPLPVLVPMAIAARLDRPGRKVSLASAVLTSTDGTEVAGIKVLRIRRDELRLPEGANLATDAALAPPGTVHSAQPTWATSEGQVAFHSHGCEHRFVEGSWNEPGPVSVWIRLLHPVADGEVPSGIERVAAAADFGNGVSGSLPHEQFLFINPDLTVHLLRPPAGEWIGMRTVSYYGPSGAGLAESALFDEAGRLGRGCQSLFVDHR